MHVIRDVSLDLLSRNPCLVRVGLVLNDGLVLAVPACQYITTYLPTCGLSVVVLSLWLGPDTIFAGPYILF